MNDNARDDEVMTPPEQIASRLIDAWCAEHGRQIPWAKAVEITAIVTKMPDAERDRLLALAGNDAPPAVAEVTEDWRPIESAPKDGTEVLVYAPGESAFPTAAHFNSREQFERDYGDPEYMEEGWYWAFGYPSDFHEEVIEPTHWRPLPEPPTAARQAGKAEGNGNG